jgi:hypothetical protein
VGTVRQRTFRSNPADRQIAGIANTIARSETPQPVRSVPSLCLLSALTATDGPHRHEFSWSMITNLSGDWFV